MASCYNNKTWRGLFLLNRILYWYRGAPTTMSVDNQQPKRRMVGGGEACDLFSLSVIVRCLSLHSSLNFHLKCNSSCYQSIKSDSMTTKLHLDFSQIFEYYKYLIRPTCRIFM